SRLPDSFLVDVPEGPQSTSAGVEELDELPELGPQVHEREFVALAGAGGERRHAAPAAGGELRTLARAPAAHAARPVGVDVQDGGVPVRGRVGGRVGLGGWQLARALYLVHGHGD